MAKKKLKIKAKLPKAGNGVKTPIKGTKEQLPKFDGGGRTPIRGSQQQLQRYNDSLDLYNTNRNRLNDLRQRVQRATNEFGVSGLYPDEVFSENMHFHPPHQIDNNQYSIENVPESYTNGNDQTYWGYGQNHSPINPEHYEGFDRRFRQNIIRGTNQTVNLPNQQDLHEYTGLWQFPRPVQPIIYEPGEKKNQSEIEGIDGRTGTATEIRNGRKYVFVDDKTTPWANEWIPVKEQPIKIQSSRPDLLQGNNQQLEFNPVGFQKGSYFTRPRQSQEIGNDLEYFDKKTGKRLMGNGGKFQDPRTDSYYTPSSSDRQQQKIKIAPKDESFVNKQSFVQAEPKQGTISKGWEILSHPNTAITNLVKKGNIPDHFSRGNTNPFDYATDVINPAFYLNAAGRTLKNAIDPQTYTDMPKAIASGIINLAGEQAGDNLNSAGLRTLGKVGDAAITLGGANMIKQPATTFAKEQIYNAIDPVGYGAKNKILSSPKTWVRNTFLKTPEERAKQIGIQLTPAMTDNPLQEVRVGQNRLDAWRTGLGLEQKYNTFDKVGDTYKIRRMNPTPGEFSSIHTDLQAHDISKRGYYSGEDPLISLAKKHDNISSPKISTKYGDYSINDIRKYLMKEGDTGKPWEQQRIVEKAKNTDFTHSVYDADKEGIMGSFRWDVNKTPEGDLHFQSNDKWDLNPFENRGGVSIKDKSDILGQYHFKPLENLEALKLVGGKPYNIQNNFIVDPSTYQIKRSFKDGGKVNTDWEIVYDNEWELVK